MTQLKLGVFGLGLTGTSIYNSLSNDAISHISSTQSKEQNSKKTISNLSITTKQESFNIICYDENPITRNNFAKKFGNKNLIPITDKEWNALDKIIISPGIPPTHSIFKLAKINNIQITSDIEIFTEQNAASNFIFISGTNGKSTSTALTGHILKKLNLNYYIGGNIGIPVMSLPRGQAGYIFELSSFQIELLNQISPNIAAITNVTPDHLDRYKLADYIAVKERILTPEALKIIGINSDISQNIYKKFNKIYGSQIIAVSNSVTLKNGIYCNNDYLEDNFFDQQKYSIPTLPYLKGIHNKENIGISYAICRALGVSGRDIISALESFKGLKHRMQYIGSYENIAFYNDSKATNISSALSSLSTLNNIIWFAGGKFKENSFDDLKPVLKNIKKAYLFGDSKDLFAKFLEAKIEYEICYDLAEAFNKAIKNVRVQSLSIPLNFLLAPACSSYDQFKNFEERGQLFTELFCKLKIM